MKDYTALPFHPTAENIVDILCQKTGTDDRTFFRVLVAYYFAKMASSMRINVDTPDRGEIPVNLYAIDLAPSGTGKNYSSNIIEDHILADFRETFIHETFPDMADQHLQKIAIDRTNKGGDQVEVEEIAVKGEFKTAGAFAFSFDSATSAAVKQMRHKLLMANAGAISLEIDEIGSNLLGNVEALKVFFELFDVGKVKQKLIKNTAESVRNEELEGRTPTNMLLFGTPSKLFDGGRTEEEMISMLEAGMARRCFFGFSQKSKEDDDITPEELFDKLTDSNSSQYLVQVGDDFAQLADSANFGQNIALEREQAILLLEYQQHCQKRANAFPEHQPIHYAEMSHRYFKALKLAGAYAFVDESPDITTDHIHYAIRLAEESGKAFAQIMKRDKNYVKLAKYLASAGKEVTHADLVEELPYYKGSAAQKQEMLTLAIAYGYKHNIVIKKSFTDGIEFLHGESLDLTDLDAITLSYSKDIAHGYQSAVVPFNKLHQMTQNPKYHWCVHHFEDGHRHDKKVIQGFDLVVLDVDNGVSLDTAKMLLKDYTYLIYTTKRHTDKENRFRIVLPMSHKLKMNRETYHQFMNNVYEWLPFEVDSQTADRARKWMSHNGHYEYNEGNKLLNSLLFIPKTAKDDERKKFIADHQSLSNIERWFVRNTSIGNRSNQLIKYALLLVDAGQNLKEVQNNVMALNSKLRDKMDEAEIVQTILVSAAQAIAKRDA